MTFWPSISRSPAGTVIVKEEAGRSLGRKRSVAFPAPFSLAEPPSAEARLGPPWAANPVSSCSLATVTSPP
jgi:hypothetical protein